VILAIDAGNTRLKWALHDGERFIADGAVPLNAVNKLVDAWKAFEAPAHVIVSNVAGPPVQMLLEESFRPWNATPVWVVPKAEQCGVKNLYENPGQLGPDRWAAIIGARHLAEGACLVVNAGTAMTVDALTSGGEFLGGLIVPGFDLMHTALEDKTARLSATSGSFVKFPRNSADAITSGAINALCGAVERMCRTMAERGDRKPEVLLGGGAGVLLAEHLDMPVRKVDKLVLEGLVQIAGEPA
jgi:type III pantothenate kinase